MNTNTRVAKEIEGVITPTKIPNIYGTNINYHGAGEEQWRADGFKPIVNHTPTAVVNKQGFTYVLDEVNESYGLELVPLSQTEIDEYNVSQMNKPINDEYALYQQRKEKGVEMYLKQSAQLRLSKSGGQITELEHQAIENALRPIRDEVVLGQWLTARALLVELGTSVIGVEFYNSILDEAEAFIKESYGIIYP